MSVRSLIEWVRKWMLLTLLAVFAIGASWAENLDVQIFSISHGLSNSHVTALLQDSRGFIWVGSADGLNRYDGYGFNVYRHNPVDSSSIVGNAVQAIVETKDGNIWIGTKNSGLSVWNRQSGSFTNIRINDAPFNQIKECGVFGLHVINDDVWIKTRNFVVRLSSDLSSHNVYGHYSSVFKTGSGICYPMVNDEKNLWIGSKDGLHQFNLSTKTFERIAFRTEDVSSEISGLVQIDDSTLLLTTFAGVYRYDLANDVIHTVLRSSDRHPNMRISSLYRQGGRVWITTTEGILYADAPFVRFESIEKMDFNLRDLRNATNVLIDRSGLLWVGTQHEGLCKVNLVPPKFNSLSAGAGDFSFTSYDFEAICVDSKGFMWLGTYDRGVYRIDPNRVSYQHFPILPIYNPEYDPSVYAITEGKDGRMWFGTSNGIFVLDKSNGQITEFDYANSAEFKTLLRSNTIHDILEDKLGYVWFATQFGLYKFNGKTLVSFFSDDDNEKSLCSDAVNTLYEDSEGWIWIGTNQGVNILKPTEEGFTRLQNEPNKPMLISHNIILSFVEDKDNRVLIGTQSGLSYYDKKNHRSGFWQGNHELEVNKIYALEVDAYNRIWMSVGRGIFSLVADETLLKYTKKDGVSDFNFNADASFNFNNKELYFAGDKGLTIIRPDSISQNLIRPQVVITRVVIERKGKVVHEYKGEIKDLDIKYRSNQLIKVEYAAMEFTDPASNSYKVFLDGYDETWRPVTKSNVVTFSNLSPGDYTLKITGSNSDFIWNNEPRELQVKVTPPLWMSNYAYAFYLIFGFFLIQTLINYRIRHYRKAYRSLQEKANDKKKIEAQKETLSHINQSLTDSISYAKRIQEAMIPSEEMVREVFSEAFVYFRPKDIVSGDFYWTHQKGDKLFIAAVDCTGHGVPGAFMSIIGFDLLKNIVEVKGIECPADILNELNKEVVSTFHKNGHHESGSLRDVNDGMDLALVVFNKSENTIMFSGAMNPLYMVRDNEVIAFKGDRYPIGYVSDGATNIFSKQEIEVYPNDVVYLFSDGYADQFGGPEGKKFKYRRFRHLLLNIHKLPIDDQKAILHQKMEEWMGGQHPQVDDILLIGLKLEG